MIQVLTFKFRWGAVIFYWDRKMLVCKPRLYKQSKNFSDYISIWLQNSHPFYFVSYFKSS